MGIILSTSQNMKENSSFYHLKHFAFKETISSIPGPGGTLLKLQNHSGIRRHKGAENLPGKHCNTHPGLGCAMLFAHTQIKPKSHSLNPGPTCTLAPVANQEMNRAGYRSRKLNGLIRPMQFLPTKKKRTPNLQKSQYAIVRTFSYLGTPRKAREKINYFFDVHYCASIPLRSI